MPDAMLPEWNKAYRIINSAFPPISVFEEKGQGHTTGITCGDIGFEVAGCESHGVLLNVINFDHTPHMN